MRSLTESDRLAFAGLHPIFRDVVDPDFRRYGLATPWREGGYAYATNGSILVRTPLDDLNEAVRSLIPDRDDPAHGRRPKDPGSMFTAFGPHAETPVDLPAVCGSDPCPECGGFGGVARWPLMSSRRTRHRPLLEFDPCEECEGALVLRSQEPIPLGSLPGGDTYDVAEWVVGLLARHKARVYLPVEFATGLCRDGVAFRFTVGRSVEGMAMPLVPASRRVSRG